MRPARLPRRMPNAGQRRISYQSVAIVATFALLAMMVAGPYMTFKPRPYTGEGSPLRQILYVTIFGMLLFAARVTARPARLLVLPLSLALALGWCWLSLTWAINLDVGSRRLFLTTLIALSVFIAVEQIGAAKTIGLMRWIMAITLAASYLAVVLFPSLGTHTAVVIEGFGLDPGLIGDWRGVFEQKNFAGAFFALTIFVFLFDARSVPLAIRVGVIGAAAFFLYRSGAKTSIYLLVPILALAWGYLFYNPRYRLPMLFVAITGLLMLAIVAVFLWARIAEPFSRPDGFTGRVQIWAILLAYWRDNWFGSGFGSFWNIGNDSPVYRYVKSDSWLALVPIGHNGYLDLLAQTGLPGLVLVVAATLVFPLTKLFASPWVDRSRGALLLGITAFCAGHNMTETSLFDRDSIVQVLLMFAIAMISVECRPYAPSTVTRPSRP